MKERNPFQLTAKYYFLHRVNTKEGKVLTENHSVVAIFLYLAKPEVNGLNLKT